MKATAADQAVELERIEAEMKAIEARQVEERQHDRINQEQGLGFSLVVFPRRVILIFLTQKMRLRKLFGPNNDGKIDFAENKA